MLNKIKITFLHKTFCRNNMKSFSSEIQGRKINFCFDGEILELIVYSDNEYDELESFCLELDSMMYLYLGSFPEIKSIEYNGELKDITKLANRFSTDSYFNRTTMTLCDITSETVNEETYIAFKNDVLQIPFYSMQYLVSYAANVVREIYSLYLQGIGKARIGRILGERGILIPTLYKREVQGLNFNNPNALETTKVWSFQTIHQILNNEVYIGNLVQNKISTLSYKDKKKIQLSPDKWIRVENAHEPIISKEAFERVKALQKIKTKSINAQDPKYESIFSGLIFCADCKHSMIRKYNRRGQHEFVGYMCSTYKTHGNRVCTSHSIDYEELTDAVLLSIQREARKILSNDDVEELKKTSCRNRRIENIEKEIEFAEERKQRINKFKKKTYQSYLEELISKADYKEYTANYDKELEEIEAEISGLEKRREDDKELESEYQEWVDKFSEYVDIDKLTRGIVIELIERIDVSEDGSICIHYRFKNPYED